MELYGTEEKKSFQVQIWVTVSKIMSNQGGYGNITQKKEKYSTSNIIETNG